MGGDPTVFSIGASRARGRCLAFAALAILVIGLAAPAHADSDPNICLGVDFDAKHPLVVSKISASPRVNFVMGSEDNAACPAETAACRKKVYLIPGDLVLTGRVQGAFTCVSYQSPLARRQDWTNGWLPTTAMAAVAPMSSPKVSDWIGSWVHAGGEIAISIRHRGKLKIEGEQIYPAAQSVHNGVLGAEVKPSEGMIAFAEDGSIPFEEAGEGQCQVRMQRIGPWLLVEDNQQCGGIMVTFTGLYRRGK
jgi:hypothetical protein